MEENERFRKISKDAEDTESSQYLEDERIAIFLQNEEFVRELRRNEDFVVSLHNDLMFSRETDPHLQKG